MQGDQKIEESPLHAALLPAPRLVKQDLPS